MIILNVRNAKHECIVFLPDKIDFSLLLFREFLIFKKITFIVVHIFYALNVAEGYVTMIMALKFHSSMLAAYKRSIKMYHI